MNTLLKTVLVGVVITGIAFPAWAQSSEKQYTFTGKLSASNLVNVNGPESVRAAVYLTQDGKRIGTLDQFVLRPVDTDKDTWVGEFHLTAAVSEGVYVQLMVNGEALYADGTVLELQGSTTVFTGTDNAIDVGIIALSIPYNAW
jgi:hypothetical protein